MSSYIWLIYGVASAAALGFAALSPLWERDHRVRAALALFGGWVASNQFNFAALPIGFPVLDSLIAYIIGALWMERPDQWKARIFAAIIVQLLCHVIYQAALACGYHIGYSYKAALNALFVCQLVIVSSSGMRRGIRNSIGMFGAGIGDRLRVPGMARNTPR